MNACLWGENPKQYSFFLSNLCQSWVLPQMKQALLWAFGLLPPNPSFIWQLLPGPGNMPTGTFFFFFCTEHLWCISSNCQRVLWCNCSCTPWNTHPGNARPAVRCHICRSPATLPWETWSKGVCLALWGLTAKKRQSIVRCAAKKIQKPP